MVCCQCFNCFPKLVRMLKINKESCNSCGQFFATRRKWGGHLRWCPRKKKAIGKRFIAQKYAKIAKKDCLLATEVPEVAQEDEFDAWPVFEQCDELCFNNKLTGHVDIEWTSFDKKGSFRSTFAVTQPRHTNRRTKIKILLNRDRLRGVKYDFFVNIFVHEMIHAFLLVTKTEDKDDFHGPTFKKMIDDLNERYNVAMKIRCSMISTLLE